MAARDTMQGAGTSALRGAAGLRRELQGIERAVAEVAERFAAERAARAERDALERADFDALAQAGFLRTGLPRARDGVWNGLGASIRPTVGMVRAIAAADPAVALVASMHPIVTCYWLVTEGLAARERAAWNAQCDFVHDSIAAGHCRAPT